MKHNRCKKFKVDEKPTENVDDKAESDEHSILNEEGYANKNSQERELCEFIISNIAENSKDLPAFYEELSKVFKLTGENKKFFINAVNATYDLMVKNQKITWSEIDSLLDSNGISSGMQARCNCVKAIREVFEKIQLITLLKYSATSAQNNLGTALRNKTAEGGMIPGAFAYDAEIDTSKEISYNTIKLHCPKLAEILDVAKQKSNPSEKYRYILDKIGFDNEEPDIKEDALKVMLSAEILLTDYNAEISYDDLFKVVREDRRIMIRGIFCQHIIIFSTKYGSGKTIKVTEFVSDIVRILK